MSFSLLGRLVILTMTVALVGMTGIFFGVSTPGSEAEMRLQASSSTVRVGDMVTVAVIVSSAVPTNVFSGEVHFDPALLSVASIDYNISAADLWAEEPWYADGAGVITFAGGTTKPGGFTGTEELLKVTFTTEKSGAHLVTLDDVRILLHDGLGSDAAITGSLETIITATAPTRIVAEHDRESAVSVAIVDRKNPADLNGDGRVGIRDTSIFMQHLATQNLRSDFNGDGRVSLADYSIFTQLR